MTYGELKRKGFLKNKHKKRGKKQHNTQCRHNLTPGCFSVIKVSHTLSLIIHSVDIRPSFICGFIIRLRGVCN